MNRYSLLVLLMSCALLSVSDGSIVCSETSQCTEDTLESTDVWCYGYIGCSYAEIITDGMYAFGFKANSRAIVSSDTLSSYGFRGSEYSIIKASYVRAYGHSSVTTAEISALDNDIIVEYFGYYAGRDAFVICYSGDTCHVDCGKAHGCVDSSLLCLTGSKCTWECDEHDPENCLTVYDSTTFTDGEITGIYGRMNDERKNGIAVGSSNFDVADAGVKYGGSSEKKTSSFGIESVIVAFLMGALVFFVVGYRCKAKQVKYAEFTQLLN